MPALDDIRALRAAKQSGQPVSRLAIDDQSDEDDSHIQESGMLRPEDERLAASGSAPFSAAAPAARWEAQLAPDSSGWGTKDVQALKPMWTASSDDDAEAFCVRFSPDDALLAAGCGDGVVRVFHTDGGRLAYRLEACAAGLPTTALRFRPATASSKTRNVLLCANADGTVQHWHITSSRCLHTVTEEGNQVFALDYQLDGTRFATGGKDYAVRVYDEATKTCVIRLGGDALKTSQGHSNRVFSVKFSATDPNMLVSAGWDNTVQVWDLQTQSARFSIYGPHVCGDAIDLCGDTLLTGSWRPNKQLELWDLDPHKPDDAQRKLEDVPWRPNASARQLQSEESCLLYAAQFCKQAGADLIAAGGTGAGEVKIFSRSNKSVTGSISSPNGVYGIDFAHNGRMLAIAGGDSSIRVVHVPQ